MAYFLIVGLALVVGGRAVLRRLAGECGPLGTFTVRSDRRRLGLRAREPGRRIATDLKGLGNAAAGTFLGGTTFLALGVAGLSAAVVPIRAPLPGSVLLWSTSAPLPLLALGSDGDLSRLDGLILLLWATRADRSPTQMRSDRRQGGGQPAPAVHADDLRFD